MLKDIRSNPLLLTDCYNLSHENLKINVDFEASHIYNRTKPMILYGFREIVNSILSIQITKEMIDEAEFHAKRMGLIFPKDTWMRVVDELNGYVPLQIQSLPEGSYCPVGTPFAQIRNTVKGYGELVSWFEPVLMMSYFPATCATQAFRMAEYLEQKRRQYDYDESFLLRFHSFGFRGSRSLEDAYFASSAWNLFLQGTDDFHSAKHTPNAKIGSISALAHKVVQQFDDELDCYTHAIKATADAGQGIVALVIDTYDAYRFIRGYLPSLANYAKELGVHIVVRPDSGDTWEQVAEAYRIVERNNITNVSAIIGEGMDFENAKKADVYFETHNVPLSFVSYGIGAGFYNYINRDTLGFALKTSFSNGKPRMKFSENPIKRSIPDIVNIVRNKYNDMIVVRESEVEDGSGLYQTVYRHDGKDQTPYMLVADETHWLQVQERAKKQITQQHIIYLSDDIRNTIKEIQKQHL